MTEWVKKEKKVNIERRRKMTGVMVHQSKVFSHYNTETNDYGNQVEIPVYKGVTLTKPPKQIRKPQLTHNNSKRRRINKMYVG